ncbi:MAG: methionyl-tRNA formyltransferase [Planctomycetales bacterium]
MRIVMMGTGAYAVPTFQAICDSQHEVVALFTRPDRGGPGRKPARNPMRDTAGSVRVFDPEDANDAESEKALSELHPDLLVVCDYGQILSDAILDLATDGGFNLHASLLPKYRGAAPINWAVYHGETETGNTVIHMNRQMDAGPCVSQQTISIATDETAAELEIRLATSGAQLVLETIDSLKQGNLQRLPQDPQQVTRARKLRKSDGEVDWTRSAEQICNQVRALKPWPKTYTHWIRNEKEPLRLILDRVSVHSAPVDAGPGIVAMSDGCLVIGTGDGALSLDQLQPAGKRVLSSKEFLRGYPVQPSDRLA